MNGWNWQSSTGAGRRRAVGSVEVTVPTTSTWTHDASGAELTMTVDVRDRLMVTELRFRAADGDASDGVTHDLLRLPLASLARKSVLPGGVREDGIERVAVAGDADRMKPARRTRITDDLLRDVAAIYNGHKGRQPRQAVIDHYADKSERQVDNYIAKARERGFIEDTRPGMATNRKDAP